MIRLEEFGLRAIPRRGWPGRRRAIAVLTLQVLGALVAGAAFLLAVQAFIVLIWAGSLKP